MPSGPRSPPPVTPDGRYLLVRGRLWRCSDPSLSVELRTELTRELMAARRDKRAAMRTDDAVGGEQPGHGSTRPSMRSVSAVRFGGPTERRTSAGSWPGRRRMGVGQPRSGRRSKQPSPALDDRHGQPPGDEEQTSVVLAATNPAGGVLGDSGDHHHRLRAPAEGPNPGGLPLVAPLQVGCGHDCYGAVPARRPT